MVESVTLNQIFNELKNLKKEVDYIKNHMIDIEVIFTKDEEYEFDESLKELEEGRTFSFEEIKKDRQNA